MFNANLDLTADRAQFRDKGRTQVRQLLSGDTADALYNCLDQQTPWSMAYRNADGPTRIEESKLEKYSDAEREALDQEISRIAETEFQFRYRSFMMVTEYLNGKNRVPLLNRVLEYLNHPDNIAVFRSLTGVENIIKVDAQATCYRPGDFLKVHNDFKEKDGREVAYVINLSPHWQADWGGLLTFTDESGNIQDSFVPHFNSMSLFRVPTLHFVSQVGLYAPANRYAITGWFRSA